MNREITAKSTVWETFNDLVSTEVSQPNYRQRRAMKRIKKETEKLVATWKRYYKANPDRLKFLYYKQKAEDLVKSISEHQKKLGQYHPNWSIQLKEAFLEAYERGQI